MGLVLQWANLYGYVRCKVGGKSNLRTMAKNYLTAQMFKQVGEISQHPHHTFSVVHLSIFILQAVEKTERP